MNCKRITAALLCLALTGCSASASVENLLTPPKLTAEQNEIYQALTNSIGRDIKLKYPRGGEYRSAFVMYNIDDEPGDEALVFYESQSVQSGESALRMKLMDKYDGEWQAVYDLACAGSDVDSISFAGLGTGENVDIIVCYSMLNQTEKSFSVLNYSGGVPVELHSSSYSCLEVIDLNSDGNDELVAVVTDKANQQSVAMMFTNSENGFEKLSEIPLSGAAAEYVSVTKGMIDESTTALFLDYSRGSGQYGTDVVYCFGNRILNPDSIGASADSSIISRFTNDYMADIHSTDIDGDGFVEIPSTTPLPGYETLTRPEQLCAVQWYTITFNNYTLEHYSYYSNKYRFVLLFPNRWRGVVSAVVNSQENEIIFVAYDPATGLTVDESTELMRIRTIDRDDKQAIAASKKYRLLAETEDKLYCCLESTGYKTGSLALTESELENSFIVLDQ